MSRAKIATPCANATSPENPANPDPLEVQTMTEQTEPARRTLAEFIDAYAIRAEVTRIPARPDMDIDGDDAKDRQWNAEARHWVVTLRRAAQPLPLAVLYSQGKAHTKPPTCADVLDSLASDSTWADASFEEWCSDLGYDRDSRRAERTYRTCQRAARNLRLFLGSAAAYRELTQDIERQ
jgi:hypothetical protein